MAESLLKFTWRGHALHRAGQPEVGRKCCNHVRQDVEAGSREANNLVPTGDAIDL